MFFKQRKDKALISLLARSNKENNASEVMSKNMQGAPKSVLSVITSNSHQNFKIALNHLQNFSKRSSNAKIVQIDAYEAQSNKYEFVPKPSNKGLEEKTRGHIAGGIDPSTRFL